MADIIRTVRDLEQLYGPPNPVSLSKVADHVTPLYAKWITQSRFCVLASVGPQGTDASPRGDQGPVVQIESPKRLLLPDWHGNNRLDTLRNIIADGRISLMFLVSGSDNVVRVNGRAKVSAGSAMRERFARAALSGDKPNTPRSVIIVEVEEVYYQCARALNRSALWCSGDESAGLPTAGQFNAEQVSGFDAEEYDRQWPGRAARTLW